MRILSIDHGARSGYAVIENGCYIASGCFNVDEPEVGDKMVAFESYAITLIEKYDPSLLCVEIPHDRVNGHTSLVLIGYYTTLLKEAARRGIECLEIHPSSMKKMITGDGGAEKAVVAHCLSKRLEIPLEKLKVPVYYKVPVNRGKIRAQAGDIRHYVYDESDAVALAYFGAVAKGDCRQ